MLCNKFSTLCEEISSIVEFRLVGKRLALSEWLWQAVKLEQSYSSWYMTFSKTKKTKKVTVFKDSTGNDSWHALQPQRLLSVFPLPLIFLELFSFLAWCLTHQFMLENHVIKPKQNHTYTYLRLFKVKYPFLLEKFLCLFFLFCYCCLMSNFDVFVKFLYLWLMESKL